MQHSVGLARLVLEGLSERRSFQTGTARNLVSSEAPHSVTAWEIFSGLRANGAGVIFSSSRYVAVGL